MIQILSLNLDMDFMAKHGFFQTIYVLALTDCFNRISFVGILSVFRIGFTCRPIGKKESRLISSARIEACLGALFLVIRSILPVAVWGCYFIRVGNGSYFNMTLGSIYLIIKFLTCLKLITFALFYVFRTCQALPIFGDSIFESLGSSESCIVCFDEIQTPVALSCNHCFCELCILQWLEKENSCPVCRTRIEGAGMIKYASTNVGSVCGVILF